MMWSSAFPASNIFNNGSSVGYMDMPTDINLWGVAYYTVPDEISTCKITPSTLQFISWKKETDQLTTMY